MTPKASQMSDEIKVAADEIKVAAEMGVAATEPNILAIPEEEEERLSPKLSNDSPRSEKKEYPVDPSFPDILNGIYGTDEFRMYTFKVKPCSRAYSHDWTECPFVHPGENAKRRDPRKYHYSCVPCPEFRKGVCPKGDACEYAHGIFECCLHPAQYRTRLCKDETSCTRRVCFFAHKLEELRPLYASTGSAVPSPRSYSSSAPSFDMGSFIRKYMLGYQARKFIPVETVKGFTGKDYVDLESGLMTKEVHCEYFWKEECPRYFGYENAPIGRIVKELKDKGYALEYISVERVKELKDEGYGFKCIHIEPVKGLTDDGHALKFIPVEAVKVSKDDDCALKFIPVETVKELKAHGYAMFIPVETVKELEDEYNIKMESGDVIDGVVNKSWLKNKCIECFGYANDYIEKMAKPEMGLLFSGATMQNIYQLVTSGMVNTGKGKTLMKLNEAAFMMLLYGLVMPRRAAGHVALAIGVALASAAYLITMSYAF